MYSPIAFRRSYASSVSARSCGCRRYAYARCPRRPTRPRQLVELREPEHVGPVDHERVHRGHVETALHDGRADEHVVRAVGEVEHDPLETAFVHLPVRDRDPGLRHEVPHLLGDVLDVLHAVVHVEDLALPQQLAPDRLRHGAVVVLAHVREDRLPRLGRGLHQGQVADPGEAHLERAGDRRGREGEHVHVLPEVLDLLLVLHAETLLLVDHEQPHVLELHIARQEAMGADDDVDLARFHPGDDRVLLGGREEPRDHLDAYGIAGEAFTERLPVLVREERGGREDRHLLAVLDRLERRPAARPRSCRTRRRRR